jgi:hypothetical protein
MKPYPVWVCFPCGEAARGTPMPKGHVCTVHMDICHVCGKVEYVTEPRDFGYPKFAGHAYESKSAYKRKEAQML